MAKMSRTRRIAAAVIILLVITAISTTAGAMIWRDQQLGGGGGSSGGGGGGNVSVTIYLQAKNIAFNLTTITVPAGANVTIQFSNEDSGIQHNFALFNTSAAQNVIFRGKVITGVSNTTYNFQAPSTPGSYFFHCDIHPSIMTGTFVVTEAQTTSVAIYLQAKNIAYNLTTITVPAGANVTVYFSNEDSGIQHNFAVYDSSAAQNVIFRGKVITGVSNTTYNFQAPSTAGSYFFRCDIHPSIMTGTFVVTAGGGGGGGGQPSFANITIGRCCFTPSNLTVEKGVNVTWTNNDTLTHRVTSLPGSPQSFDSGNIAPGESFSFILTQSGTYQYDDPYYTCMNGTITVNSPA